MNSPFAMVVEVTNRCNLRRPHCTSDLGCVRADEMSLDLQTAEGMGNGKA